jgi:predicted Holliday junction resolvase-like endonuclease
MAQKRKTKKNRFRKLLFFILIPLVVWLLAFVVWLYWNSIISLFRQGKTASSVRPKAAQRESNEKRVKERISDEERQKLDEILKKQAK